MLRRLVQNLRQIVPNICQIMKFYFAYFQIVPHYYQYLMRKSEEERSQAKSAYLSGLLELTKAKSKDGPFFMGKDFGMVTS